MNCLLISNPINDKDDIVAFLTSNHIEYEWANDQLIGIQKAHQNKFDVVVLEANQSEYPIDRAIQIFKDCNPKVRIIVRTDMNSRELETQVRKAHIYYYHVNSFGSKEFNTALSSALEMNKTH